jgi:hypothetical protein
VLCRQITERGQSNWRELTLAQQFKAAAWASGWMMRHQHQSCISSTLLRIGAGSRERRHGRGKRYLPEDVVLTMEVEKKRPDLDCGCDRLPDFIQMKVPVDGRHRVLAMPTDVREKRPAPTGQVDPYKVLTESGSGSPKVNGSLCAQVQNTSGNTDLRYVLTCHHVAFLSLLSPIFTPDTSAVNFHQVGNSIDQRMGKSSRGTRLVREPQFSLDAALIRLDADSPARKRSFWSAIPTNWVKDVGEIGMAFAGDARVYNRRSDGGWPIEFSEMRADFIVEYSGGGRARFSQLIEYRLPSSVSTASGDSGGALISNRFNLIGMHIAGVGRYGYAIPAYQLLRSVSFSPSITLAMPASA